jgi:short-subunit dehydrogenase
LIAHGTLPDQQLTQRSVELTMKELSTNALSTISLLTLVANVFESQKSGAIAVITSVAGDRGRQSNYIYGSAKAMVTTFLSGLRQRLTPQGIAVITIKPGFVDTPMTKEFKKGLLWAQPQQVAKSIVKACEKGSSVIYTPSFWALIMLIIKIIPERIFQKLKI